MMRVLSTQEPMWSTGGIFKASQIARRPGPARAAAEGSLKSGLGVGHGGAAGVQDQDVVGNESAGDGGVTQILADLGVVAAHHAHGAPDLAGLDGVDEGRGGAAQGAEDGFHGKAAHLVDRGDRNEDPLGLAVGEVLHGHFDHFPAPFQGVFRGEFQVLGMREFGLGGGGDEMGVVTGGQSGPLRA